MKGEEILSPPWHPHHLLLQTWKMLPGRSVWWLRCQGEAPGDCGTGLQVPPKREQLRPGPQAEATAEASASAGAGA